MQATIEIMGKQVAVEWSRAADKQMQTLTEPLAVEMELYFSCLIRKAVRFGANPQLKIGFRPVMTSSCNVNDFKDEPPVTDFPIVKPEAYVPKRLTLDYKNGNWIGDFFLQKNRSAN
jgi:hypothetical protein